MFLSLLLWSATLVSAAVKTIPALPARSAPKLAAVGALLNSSLSIPSLELSPGQFYAMPLSAPAAKIPLMAQKKMDLFARRAALSASAIERPASSSAAKSIGPDQVLSAAQEVLGKMSLAKLKNMPENDLEDLARSIFDGFTAKRKVKNNFVSDILGDQFTARAPLQLTREFIKLQSRAPENRQFGLRNAIHATSKNNPEAARLASVALARDLPNIKSSERYLATRRLVSAAARYPSVRAALIEVFRVRLGLASADPASQLSLIKRLPRSSTQETEDIALSLALTLSEDPAGRQALWPSLVRVFLENPTETRLKRREGPQLRSPSEERMLRDKLPTLFTMTQDPERMGRFVSLLTFLRLVYPYYWPNGSEQPPAAWSKQRNLVFELNELHIMPASESFRRFIIEDTQGTYSVEIKIPGQMADRDELNIEHFTVADRLWKNHPKDPGVVRPVMLPRYVGTLRIFGRIARFTRKNPLGIMIFRYEDGKRLSNADTLLASLAKRKNTPIASLLHHIRAQMAIAAIRLHRARWAGSTDGNDMHPENIKVLGDGRAALVADFGAFMRQRRPLSAELRRTETTGLIGRFDVDRDPDQDDPFDFVALNVQQARDIYSDVTRRLLKGVNAPRQRVKIRREVLRELGLSPE